MRICLADTKNTARTELKKRLKLGNIEFSTTKKPHTHAKTILVDGRDLLIGSINYTKNSLDNNREINLILRETPFLESYQKIIQKDCKRETE